MKYLIYTISGLLGVFVFVAIAQVSQLYSPTLTYITQQAGIFAVVTYIAITFLAIVVAPLGTGFLLPIAANSFGPFLAAVYSIVGWMLGSLVAFALARRYGQRFVKDTVLIQKVHQFEKKMSDVTFFNFLVVLRMALPVDLMSYVLGVGSSVGYKVFTATTLIGITPFAFLFSYASVSSVNIQVVVSTIGTLAFLLGMYFIKTQYQSSQKDKK